MESFSVSPADVIRSPEALKQHLGLPGSAGSEDVRAAAAHAIERDDPEYDAVVASAFPELARSRGER
jgi:hypothetical protein